MNNAFCAGDILVPKNSIDMEKWAVIACDQYTSEKEYWEETERLTAGAPSTFNLILPEIYLEDADVEERIKAIHENMDKYLNEGVFEEYRDSLIYIERIQSNGIIRAGILGAVDLEEYDFNKGSTSQVRATEATVVERIPPRIKIRKGAALELPHIMILIDDENKTVIEPLAHKKETMKKLYDFKLMQGGGSISGYLINDDVKTEIFSRLSALGDKEKFREKYGTDSVLLYAMGDGNHSLATAKEYYEQLKRDNPHKDMTQHPARYALAEIVDLHSPALDFEAIHRVITGVNREKLLEEMEQVLKLSNSPSQQGFTIVCNDSKKQVYIHECSSNLTVGSLQNFLDSYLKENEGKIDYIHGTETVSRLVNSPDSIGFILPDMEKSQLFPTVIKDGALPRKTFSMGHAQDKRYYIEARKIK